MRARVKRRQTIRRLEIVAIIVVIAVSLGIGIYYALNASDPRSHYDLMPVSPKNFDDLYQASVSTSYGTPGQNYLTRVKTLTGLPTFTKGGNPILVYVGAEFCPYCAVQRYSMIMALMRFGNFTGLEYMTSAFSDGDYSTFTFRNATYTSSYVVFESFEIYDRNDNPLATLPANYTSSFQQYGGSAFPFLNFADQYYISGAILDPSVLGSLNQSQVISSIMTGNTLGSEIKQAANVITAVICETTGNKPASVCDNPSITALTISPLSYSPPTNSGSALILSNAASNLPSDSVTTGRDYRGWA